MFDDDDKKNSEEQTENSSDIGEIAADLIAGVLEIATDIISED